MPEKPHSLPGESVSTPSTEMIQEASGDPKSIGRFRLLRRLGSGAFGTVYLAHDPQLARQVALKILNASVATNPRRVERFFREARAAANLRHPNIVPLFEAGEEGNCYYIITEFIDGQTLDERIPEGGLPPREAARIAQALAEAVAYAHGEGIVHRDIKPANVMQDRHDRPHLMDFGLAARKEEVERLTRDGAVLGTVSYMAPEQAAGQQCEAHPASDQYSLGIVLYELLTGQLPFEGPAASVLAQHANSPPTPPRRLRPDVPHDLETICLRSLEKEPARRYASCQEMADDLRRWLEGEPIRARRLSRAEQFARWAKRNRAVAVLSGLTLLSLLLGAVVAGYLALVARAQAQRADEMTHEARAESRAARTAETEAKRRTAEANFARALTLMDKGDLGRGLLWCARARQEARVAGDSILEEACRLNLSAWSERQAALELVLPHPKPVNAACFGPAGVLLTGSEDGKVRFWNSETGQEQGQPLTHPDGILAMAYGARGDRLATTCRDGKLRVWNLVTRKPLFVIQIANSILGWDAVAPVACDPVGERILSGLWSGARLYSGTTGELIKRLATGQQQNAPVEGVAVFPDGRLVTVDNGARVVVWDAKTLEPLRPLFQSITGGLRAVAAAASPDGKLVAVTELAHKRVRVWDWAAAKQLGETRHVLRTHHICFSPDSTAVASASEDNTVRVWEAHTGRLLFPPLLHGGEVRQCDFSPEGDRLLTASFDGRASLWRLPRKAPTLVQRHASHVTGVDFSPDSARLVSSTSWQNPTLRLTEVGSGQSLKDLRVGKGWPAAVFFTRDGRSAVVGINNNDHGRALHEWLLQDAPSEAPLAKIHDEIWKLRTNGDRTTFITGAFGYLQAPAGNNARVFRWKADRTLEIGPVFQHAGRVTGVALSADGARGVTASRDGTSRVWDTQTGKPLTDPLVHPGEVWDVAFSPDGKEYLTTGADATIRRWRLPDLQMQGRAMQHTSPVLRLEFTPDARLLYSAGIDGVARAWHLDSGTPVGPPLEHDQPITALACSPDNRLVATGSTDTFVKIWERPDLDGFRTGDSEEAIERQTGLTLGANGAIRLLTAEEWHRRTR